MKGYLKTLVITLCMIPEVAVSANLGDLISSLRAIDCYNADAQFVVMMPQQPEDVTYNISLLSKNDSSDRWASCDYLIDCTLQSPSGPVESFGAYFNGHHYRYRGNRLQEYHVDWDSVPFMPRGIIADGVQQRVQFANLLPAFVANELEALAANPAVKVHAAIDTVVGGQKCSIVTTERFNDGMLVQRGYYRFAGGIPYPEKIETENNLGALSEQTLSVTYSAPSTPVPCPAEWNEQMLISRYPEAFERFRENNFRVENLPGTRLPQFSLPDIDGTRFSHAGDERFASPVILAVIDPTHGYAPQLISALRDAADNLTAPAELMLTFVTNNLDQITAVTGDRRPGEQILTSGRSLARDLGVTECPVVVLVGSDARVGDVILGFNKDIANVVIQKMALLQ